MKVNSAGVAYANAQIKSGNYKASGSWSFSADDGNKILGDNDWANYGKHFLAIDDNAEKETKAYYKYPFAKSDGVYRSGLVAIRQRAGQQGETEVFDAAGKLIDAIDKKEGKSMDTLVYFGGEVKSLGGGKVGGQLVRFGTASDTDLEGDFFDATTDFDVDFSTEVKSTVYYDHGDDPILGKKKLGGGIKATLTRNEEGIWIEAQLDLRDKYEAAIAKLVDQKKLGWSSGTAAYLVERERVGKSYHIKRWTLGVDASLTPIPADHRNTALPLKSLKLPNLKQVEGDLLLDDDTDASILGQDVWEQLTMGALCDLWNMFCCQGLWQILYNDMMPNDQKIQMITDGFNQLSAKGIAVATAIMGLDMDEMSQVYSEAKSLLVLPEQRKFESFRKQLEYVKSAVESLGKRAELIKENFNGTKSGAMFNAKNKEYLQSVASELVKHGNGIMDLVTPMQTDDSIMGMGKSIQALELRLAERIQDYNESIQ